LAADSVQVSDRLFEAFRQFTAEQKDTGLTSDNVSAMADHARLRIREEIATATHSSEAGAQVLLEADPQVLKAIEVMPESRRLYEMVVARK